MQRCFLVLIVVAMSAVMRAGAQPPASGWVPVTDQTLQRPADGDWLSWRRTLDGWGYSPLKQVNRSNVRALALAWTRRMFGGFQETTPLVYRGVLYLANPADVIQAVDARSGALKWEYRRKLPADLRQHVPLADVKRNLAIFGRLIIAASGDNYLYALDAETGALAWETKVLDYRTGAQQSSGAIIVNVLVVTGRGCHPAGGPESCVITAHDALTGAERWRTRTIALPGEPGGETWGDLPAARRNHVGTWMPPSYDPKLDLIYFGTSVTSPAPKFMLSGDDKTYLYHNSTLALEGKSGRIVWHYQHLVDHWDMDHPFERMLIGSPVNVSAGDVPWSNARVKRGEQRQLITGIPGKTGIVYTLDRRTGEFLWARPTIQQNIVSSIEGATGRVSVNRAMLFGKVGDERVVCPSSHGGKDWQAGAYSPVSGAMYFPLQHTCMTATAISPQTRNDSLYAISRRFQVTPGKSSLGSVQAVSVQSGRALWSYESKAATSSLFATASGLLFVGDAAGLFRALDQQTGRVILGGKPRLADCWLSNYVRRRRAAVRRGDNRALRTFRRVPESRRPSKRAHCQQHLCVRAA